MHHHHQQNSARQDTTTPRCPHHISTTSNVNESFSNLNKSTRSYVGLRNKTYIITGCLIQMYNNSVDCIRLTNLSCSHTVDTMKAAKAQTIVSPVHCQFSFKLSIIIYQRMPT